MAAFPSNMHPMSLWRWEVLATLHAASLATLRFHLLLPLQMWADCAPRHPHLLSKSALDAPLPLSSPVSLALCTAHVTFLWPHLSSYYDIIIIGKELGTDTYHSWTILCQLRDAFLRLNINTVARAGSRVARERNLRL